MKKTILLAVLVAFAAVAFAQDTVKKPAKGDWGLGFRLQGLGNLMLGEFDQDVFGNSQLLARKYMSNKIVIRAALGVGVDNSESRFASSIIDEIGDRTFRTDSSFRQTTSAVSFSIAPGAEYHLASAATRLDPYVGFVIPIGFQSATTVEIDDELKITDQADGKVQYNRDLATKRDLDGGLSFGFSALAGFNYFFSNNIAIGAEYNLGLVINSIGGNYKERIAGSIQNSPDETDITNIDNEFTGRVEDSSTKVSVSSVGINLSIFW